jgi:hypothetical protein
MIMEEILDKDSVILIECTKLFARERGLVGEYEIKKLMHLKEKLISYGIKTTAILICDEYYKDNKSFFSAILKRFNQQTYFIFREGLENMESEAYTLTKPNDLLLYASKIQL